MKLIIFDFLSRNIFFRSKAASIDKMEEIMLELLEKSKEDRNRREDVAIAKIRTLIAERDARGGNQNRMPERNEQAAKKKCNKKECSTTNPA